MEENSSISREDRAPHYMMGVMVNTDVDLAGSRITEKISLLVCLP